MSRPSSGIKNTSQNIYQLRRELILMRIKMKNGNDAFHPFHLAHCFPCLFSGLCPVFLIGVLLYFQVKR